ncbi:MAG: D-glycero-beta-D-manno-heptose 1,7-bisphosphate 7-phosphatase [Spirochaetaceae bacterium]|jgi:D-glycero-D-manno-heptose 1,7-bisphosphate phosphatase|nr:D-glycero-beta-D-manno-heptose 1,7-bisphosphate 7-phosphatase [Spirochaetaceae bacterium]
MDHLLMKTVIMAGGKGTRIAELAPGIPKPMIPVHGKPILEYQLDCLIQAGLRDILVVVGHLGEVIRAYFDKSPYKKYLHYYAESEPLGTAGALFNFLDELGDSFFLINGDIIFDVDFSRIIAAHRGKNALATLVSHPNNHPYDSALLVTDGEGRVVQWINKEDDRLYYHNRVNTGIHLFEKELWTAAQKNISHKKVDLDRDILKPLLPTRRIFAYDTPEYIKDMGTPGRYTQIEGDIETGRVAARNMKNKQRAVFLDRDGTINELTGFVTQPEDFTLIPGAAEAIKRINNSGYLAVVITNQPVIARGECSLTELDAIHQKMESELGKEGAYIDGLFYCPHHPDKGFPGERPEYKTDCACRKPKPGMILSAAEKYHIDLAASWMVGDDARDIGAGRAAGCRTALITAGSGVPSENAEAPPDVTVTSLIEFAGKYIP